MHECVHAQGQKKILGFLELELQRLAVSCLIWVLRTELGFGNAVSAGPHLSNPSHSFFFQSVTKCLHKAYLEHHHIDGYIPRQEIYMLLKYCTK